MGRVFNLFFNSDIMKLVFASIFAAVISAKSIINLQPYDLDARPSDTNIVEPATWLEELVADIGQDCAISPKILGFLIGKAKAAGQTKIGTDTVWASLRKCRTNDAVKHIMTMEYLMKNKADLYNSMIVDDTNKALDFNGDGTKDYVVDFLNLADKSATGYKKKSFKDSLSGWSKKKTAINFMKWKYYNDFFNHITLQKFQFWNRKINDLKLHKAAAEKKTHPDGTKYTKLEQFREYMPFLGKSIHPYGKGKEPAVPTPPMPVLPLQPIIPAKPMPVAVSDEEQAEQQKVYIVQNQ